MGGSDETCVVCGVKAAQKCGRCLGPAYCNKEHQKQHWATHKHSCSLYRIEKNTELGRYIVASRDIKQGEIILKDEPLVLGPRQVTISICLGCTAPVDGSYCCTLCGWPLCSAECQKVTLHKPECEFSQRRNPKIKINKFYQINQMYECITPLRCLWLRDNYSNNWESLMKMESHLKERKSTEVYSVVQTNVVNFSKIYLKVDEFDDEEFHTVCGIIDVNGFEIPGPDLIGLYGKACLLENCCVPNTSRTFDAKMNIVIRAAVPIKKGEHITTCYTDPMWGTSNRNLQLKTSKHFLCSCKRCVDPTELDTHLSSLKCESCKGTIIPPKENVPGSKWCCTSCENSLESEKVEKLLIELGKSLISLKGDISRSENFLNSTSSVLSENHYYRNEVKVALAQLYGNQGLQISAATDTLLARKKTLCEEIINLISILTPGPVRLRGILQYELYKTLLQIYKKLPKNKKSEKDSISLLQTSIDCLEDSIQILSLESPVQEEFRLAMSAQQELKEAKSLLPNN